MFWVTKKKLKRDNEELQRTLNNANECIAELSNILNEYREKYPFEFGQVVYDLQLRSAKGRYTKTKASRQHSIINEVVVDGKNYFNLVERLNNCDVFTSRDFAEEYLNSVCVEE